MIPVAATTTYSRENLLHIEGESIKSLLQICYGRPQRWYVRIYVADVTITSVVNSHRLSSLSSDTT